MSPYKHIEDNRSYHKAYYWKHRDRRLAESAAWYQAHKNDPEFMERRRLYAQRYRLKKRWGL
jgi:hypothetical protein